MPQPAKKPLHVEKEGAQKVYTNVTQIQIREDEVELVLAIREDENSAIATHRVFMSILHFIKMTNSMMEVKERFEKQYLGGIEFPKEIK